MINVIFPFLTWFRGYDLDKFKVDAISGLIQAIRSLSDGIRMITRKSCP